MKDASQAKSTMDFVADVAKRNKCNKILTREEEQELFRQHQAGNPRAKDKLILSNIKLVFNIVNKYGKKYDQYKDDMTQEGLIGLSSAVDLFDVGFETKFSTYAHYRVLQRVNRFIETKTRNVRIPNHILSVANKFRREYSNDVKGKFNLDNSTPEQVMKYADCKEHVAKYALQSILYPKTIDVVDSMFDHSVMSNCNFIPTDEIIEAVGEAMSGLDPITKDALLQRYTGPFMDQSDKSTYEKISSNFKKQGVEIHFYKLRSIVFAGLEKILIQVSKRMDWGIGTKAAKKLVGKKQVRDELANYICLSIM